MRRYWVHGVVAPHVDKQYAELGGFTAVYKAADVQAWLEGYVLRDQHIGTPYNNGWNDCLSELLADLARDSKK